MWFKALAGLLHSSNVFSIGGCLGTTAKLGPWASIETWALVKATPDRFLTHFFIWGVVIVVVIVTGAKVKVFFGQPPVWFEWPLLV